MLTVLAWFVACATAPDRPPTPVGQCPIHTDLFDRFQQLAATKFSLKIRPSLPAHHGKICRSDKQCGRGSFCVPVHGLPRRVCKKTTARALVTGTLNPTP